MKTTSKIIAVLIIVIALVQFIQPSKNTSNANNTYTFIQETKANKQIEGILQKACYDCHSNNTTYPWYSKITPVNFWMNHHIEEGKEELNLSEWSNYSNKKKKHKLDEMYEEVEEKHMPISSYTLTHSNAKLTDKEIEVFVQWAKSVMELY